MPVLMCPDCDHRFSCQYSVKAICTECGFKWEPDDSEYDEWDEITD